MTSLNDTQIVAVDALRAYKSGPESEKTTNLRTVATAFFDAREHFFTPSGEPDWLGRTHAYRLWVRETMGQASIQADELTTVQAAIRYHVGNIVRERMDSDTLKSLGLRDASPRERSVEKRGRSSEVLAIFGSGGQAIADAAEIIVAARLIEGAFARVDLEAVAGLDAESKKRVREALEAAEARVNAVKGAITARRK